MVNANINKSANVRYSTSGFNPAMSSACTCLFPCLAASGPSLRAHGAARTRRWSKTQHLFSCKIGYRFDWYSRSINWLRFWKYLKTAKQAKATKRQAFRPLGRARRYCPWSFSIVHNPAEVGQRLGKRQSKFAASGGLTTVPN